jgi:2',3'-cyclic-nucleotide 2'-phosphodiesterase
MKILAIGDIFGKTGRQVIKNQLLKLKEKHQIDFVVANVENATHGKGISYAHYKELKFIKEKETLIDIMTSGNHVFDLEETQKNIDKFSKLIRPLNSNPYHGGKGSIITECKNKKIRITNLIGRTFMPPAESPYLAMEKMLEKKD